MTFGIGRPATEEEIAAINIDVMPDGQGLPAGSGTYAEGEEVYAQIARPATARSSKAWPISGRHA